MAAFTVQRADLFPPGTVVKVFARPSPPAGELRKNNSGDPETWKPTLAKLVSLTADASTGVLSFTIGAGAGEVPSGKPVLCWAQVAGKDVYLETRPVEAVTGREVV